MQTWRSQMSRVAYFIVVIGIPVWLVLSSIRLVATDSFLYMEYNRAGFPADLYGFTKEDRMGYATYAVDYLYNAESINYLAMLEFPDGTHMYNERELVHMADVKTVFQAVFFAYGLLSVLLLLSVGWLGFNMTTRSKLRLALLLGSTFTLALIASLVLLSLVSWDFFFEQFHQLFFAEGTWRFEYSDTLIRLFPEQFWFDAALTIGLLTTVGALLILALAYLWKPQGKEQAAR